jgi:hypothetical protein
MTEAFGPLVVPLAPTPTPKWANERHYRAARRRGRGSPARSRRGTMSSNFGLAGVKFMPSTRNASASSTLKP